MGREMMHESPQGKMQGSGWGHRGSYSPAAAFWSQQKGTSSGACKEKGVQKGVGLRSFRNSSAVQMCGMVLSIHAHWHSIFEPAAARQAPALPCPCAHPAATVAARCLAGRVLGLVSRLLGAALDAVLGRPAKSGWGGVPGLTGCRCINSGRRLCRHANPDWAFQATLFPCIPCQTHQVAQESPMLQPGSYLPAAALSLQHLFRFCRGWGGGLQGYVGQASQTVVQHGHGQRSG